MEKEDLEELRKMSEEDLKKEIPDLDWFRNLRMGDEAVLSLIGLHFFRNDLNDDSFTLVKVTRVNEDGSVEIDRGNLGRFHYCVRLWEGKAGWERGEMGIRLIPPREELAERLRKKDKKKEQEVEEEFKKIDWTEVSIFKKMEILALLRD